MVQQPAASGLTAGMRLLTLLLLLATAAVQHAVECPPLPPKVGHPCRAAHEPPQAIAVRRAGLQATVWVCREAMHSMGGILLAASIGEHLQMPFARAHVEPSRLSTSMFRLNRSQNASWHGFPIAGGSEHLLKGCPAAGHLLSGSI